MDALLWVKIVLKGYSEMFVRDHHSRELRRRRAPKPEGFASELQSRVVQPTGKRFIEIVEMWRGRNYNLGSNWHETGKKHNDI